VSCGVQSFSDRVLEQTGRPHTSQACLTFIRNAREAGFDWISVDLMFGLLDQTVASAEQDLRYVVDAGLTAVVCAKLHLRSYTDTRTGVAGEQPAAWQIAGYRDRLARDGHHWPTLGEQYQMHEVLTQGLAASGYVEHPAMYFALRDKGPEKWKAIMADQDKQEAEVAIGLGGSSSCRASEAITTVKPGHLRALSQLGGHPARLSHRLRWARPRSQGDQDGPVHLPAALRRTPSAEVPRPVAVRRPVGDYLPEPGQPGLRQARPRLPADQPDHSRQHPRRSDHQRRILNRAPPPVGPLRAGTAPPGCLA
jgi:hypothetical protein